MGCGGDLRAHQLGPWRTPASANDAFRGQHHRYGRSGIDCAFNRQLSAVEFNEVFGERQPQTGAFVLATYLAVDLPERFKGFGNIIHHRDHMRPLHRSANRQSPRVEQRADRTYAGSTSHCDLVRL